MPGVDRWLQPAGSRRGAPVLGQDWLFMNRWSPRSHQLWQGLIQLWSPNTSVPLPHWNWSPEPRVRRLACQSQSESKLHWNFAIFTLHLVPLPLWSLFFRIPGAGQRGKMGRTLAPTVGRLSHTYEGCQLPSKKLPRCLLSLCSWGCSLVPAGSPIRKKDLSWCWRTQGRDLSTGFLDNWKKKMKKKAGKIGKFWLTVIYLNHFSLRYGTMEIIVSLM